MIILYKKKSKKVVTKLEFSQKTRNHWFKRADYKGKHYATYNQAYCALFFKMKIFIILLSDFRYKLFKVY